MSGLEKLKIVAMTPKRAASVEQERRNKLAQKLDEQLKLAEAKKFARHLSTTPGQVILLSWRCDAIQLW